MELTYEEKIELSYLKLQGFSYIVRNEIGSVEVFVNEPCRDKDTNGSTHGGYDTWVERAYPMTYTELKSRRHTELGEYKFITWASEPMLINDIITALEDSEGRKPVDENSTLHRYKKSLQTILDEAAPECDGWETTIVKTAREALGISEAEYWQYDDYKFKAWHPYEGYQIIAIADDFEAIMWGLDHQVDIFTMDDQLVYSPHDDEESNFERLEKYGVRCIDDSNGRRWEHIKE